MEAAALISFGSFLQVAMEQRIYHGCFYKNADGTNKIIRAGEECSVPTGECFWKDPCDVKNGVKTSHVQNMSQWLHLRTLTTTLTRKLSISG